MRLKKSLLRAHAFVFALALPLTASAAATQPSQIEHRTAVTIANFGRINDNYYRGAQPKGRDYADLAALGIKTVIDLTRDGEAGEPSAVEHAGMKFFRIPLTTQSRPSAEAVEQFLRLVNDPANQPVFVHCQGGRHRTGVMTAVYRLTHDAWDADHAFAEMKEYQFEKGIVAHNTLKNFVYDYSAQHAIAGQRATLTGTR